ncbi:MAG: DUF3048 domain-containing protein [Clostridiales bacterium]|nr:DUF3048 domain-containing protein [Clostridiales bacterium]
MKKIVSAVLIAAMGSLLFTGCGKTQEEAAVSETETELSFSEVEDLVEEEPAEEEEDTHEGEARSDLTGEWVDEEVAAQRPVAIMIGNTEVATPQYEICSADLIYEAPVEGSLTRLLAFYQDYESLEKVMSIRSSRLYYIDWALEFDAIYVHCGQAYLAKDMLNNSYVNNVNAMEGSMASVFFRDSSKSAPHNLYATGESIAEAIAIKGYETEYDAEYTSHYQFNEDDETEITLSEGEAAAVVQPGYLINKPWFVYNQETGLYDRYQYGAAQTDAITGEQLAVKNILIQVCDWYTADSEKGYLSVTTTGTGNGYYITNGAAIPVTWSKDSQTDATRYYDADGNEITLNQGKTWVCIVQNTYEENITFYASEEEFANE